MRLSLLRPVPRDRLATPLPWGPGGAQLRTARTIHGGPRARKVVRAVRAGAPPGPQKGGAIGVATRRQNRPGWRTPVRCVSIGVVRRRGLVMDGTRSVQSKREPPVGRAEKSRDKIMMHKYAILNVMGAIHNTSRGLLSTRWRVSRNRSFAAVGLSERGQPAAGHGGPRKTTMSDEIEPAARRAGFVEFTTLNNSEPWRPAPSDGSPTPERGIRMAVRQSQRLLLEGRCRSGCAK